MMMRAARPIFALSLALLAVSGVLAGLVRIGVAWASTLVVGWSQWHGVLMAACLMGAVISLERAVAFKRRVGFVAPLAALCAGLLLLAGALPLYAALLLMLAALMLTWVSFCLWRRQPSFSGALLALAPLFWLLGTITWQSAQNPGAGVLSWLLFLVLTIAAERLELSRYQPTSPRARQGFIVIMLLLLVSRLGWLSPEVAGRLYGWALVGLALWLLRHDVARRTWRMGGATRYIANCLLAGYVWLLFAGGLGAMGAFDAGAVMFDAALHAITLGFVFSMIFGHALIVLPAVSGLRVTYHPALYLAWLGLHCSLALRVYADFCEQSRVWALAGQLNALTLLLFMGSLLLVTRKARRPARAVSKQRG